MYILTFDEDTAFVDGLPVRTMSILFNIVTGVAIAPHDSSGRCAVGIDHYGVAGKYCFAVGEEPSNLLSCWQMSSDFRYDC